MSANSFFSEKLKNQTTPGPMPRINAGQSAEEEDQIIFMKTGGEKDDIISNVGIPAVAVSFFITLLLLMCVRSHRRRVENRNQPVDVEEGESDRGNWHGRSFENATVDRHTRPNGIQNEAYINEFRDHRQSENNSLHTATGQNTNRTGFNIISNVQTRNNVQSDFDQTAGPTNLLYAKKEKTMSQTDLARKYNLPVSDDEVSVSSFDSGTHSKRTRNRSIKRRQNSKKNLRVATLKKQLRERGKKYEIEGSSSKASDSSSDCIQKHSLKSTNYNDSGDTLCQPRNHGQPYATKYKILEQDFKGFRRKALTVEEQQEWARQNHLTLGGKRKKRGRSGRRQTFDIGMDSKLKTTDMGIANSKVRRNHSVLTRQSSMNPSPYKIQVQNSIRPNKKVGYFQGFKATRKSKIGGIPSVPIASDSSGSPSYYHHFETPSPPATMTRSIVARSINTLNDIPESTKKLEAQTGPGTLTTVSSTESEDTYNDINDTHEVKAKSLHNTIGKANHNPSKVFFLHGADYVRS